MATPESFGQWLRTRRLGADLTQQQLADGVRVKRESVSLWEADKAAPESEKLLSIARTLGVTDKEMNAVAGKLLGRVIYLANIKSDGAPIRAVRERPGNSTEAAWPKSVHLLASRLETRILEAGGTADAATWARRALLNPDAYVRFFPSDRPAKTEVETLSELEFVADGLFLAATGKRPDEGKHGARSRGTTGRGKA